MDQGLEGLLVTSLRLLHEFALHRAAPSSALSGALTHYGERDGIEHSNSVGWRETEPFDWSLSRMAGSDGAALEGEWQACRQGREEVIGDGVNASQRRPAGSSIRPA
jgi:hypothetical protein